MKRILILLLVLACLGAMQPTPAWSTPPRHQSAAPPDEYNNNGDDDEPYKTGQLAAPVEQTSGRGGVTTRDVTSNFKAPEGQLPLLQSTWNRIAMFFVRVSSRYAWPSTNTTR
jgi:hypothetical protein